MSQRMLSYKFRSFMCFLPVILGVLFISGFLVNLGLLHRRASSLVQVESRQLSWPQISNL